MDLCWWTSSTPSCYCEATKKALLHREGSTLRCRLLSTILLSGLMALPTTGGSWTSAPVRLSSSRFKTRHRRFHYHHHPSWSLRGGGGGVDTVPINASDPQQLINNEAIDDDNSDDNNQQAELDLVESENAELEGWPDDDEDEQVGSDNAVSPESSPKPASTSLPRQSLHQVPQLRRVSAKRRRRTSDMIQSLLERSFDSATTASTTDHNNNINNNNMDQLDESNELRQLITERANDYVQSLHRDGRHPETSLGHPKKLLHSLAPKIPAILYSPNIMLRIQSAARSDMDAGVAACLLATLARVCELYDRQVRLLQQRQQEQAEELQEGNDITSAQPPPSFHSSTTDIINERRFEQLVECVLCGLDVKRLLLHDAKAVPEQEAKMVDDLFSTDVNEDNVSKESQEHEIINNQNHNYVNEGLSLRDACRAAWGIAILGGHHYDSIGGETVGNIFLALSLRVRELLMARLERLNRANRDYYYHLANKNVDHEDDGQPTDESYSSDQSRWNNNDLVAEEIAEDAATAMWAFACVRACTGIRTVKLFETCCSILCQDPYHHLLSPSQQAFTHHNAEAGQVKELPVHLSEHAADDVVDRLAVSDIEPEDTSQPGPRLESNEKRTDRDALLDWLSPNEITDMLWALALHGSSESYLSSKEDIVLSETATALREIAFDRLLYWLRQDLDAIRIASNIANDKPSSFGGDETAQVAEAVSFAIASVIEDAVIDQEKVDGDPSLPDHRSDDATSSNDIHSLPAPDGTTSNSENISEHAFETPTSDTSQMLSEVRDVLSSVSRKRRFFSSHDLCSILWAVTELRDSLRFEIVELVTEIFVAQGQSGTNELDGGDLTNLAWALARHTSEKDPGLPGTSSVLMVTAWAAQSVLRRMQGRPEGRELDHELVLRAFQPPELGRIIWSVATTFSAYSSTSTEQDRKTVSRLFQVALLTAGERLSVFATEDLARMAWAFLEICDFDEYLPQPGILGALAKILVTIESSVLRWEKGYCSSTENESPKKVNESILFATFFGKSRASTPLWDQRIGEVKDEEDDTLDDEKSRLSAEMSGLPLLRDLNLDPSTLCKVANAYARLSVARPFIRWDGTLTRIAVRLLASENGQLMKECSFHDILRLLEAVAAGENADRQSGIGSRLFARRVVRILNDELHSRDESESPASDFLSKLALTEKCVMIHSLGKLGVRFWSGTKDKRVAYKKLRLVTDDPLFDPAHLLDVPDAYVTKLLSGLILMDILACNNNFLLLVLLHLEGRVQNMHDHADLCSLIESLGKVGKLLKVSDLGRRPFSASAEVDVAEHSNNPAVAVNTNPSFITETENATAYVDEMRRTCRKLLSATATQAIRLVPQMQAEELRRIVEVYSFLPLQEDALFNCIEAEIADRKRRWKEHPTNADHRASVNAAVKLAHNLLSARGINADEPERPKKSFLRAILFKEDDAPSSQYRSKLADQDVIEELLSKLLFIENGTASDSTAHAITEGSYYGLCYCEELVATYRRIEFNTGTHRSRYDKHRRRDIAKRVLSRLLPSPGYFPG